MEVRYFMVGTGALRKAVYKLYFSRSGFKFTVLSPEISISKAIWNEN